MHKLAPVKPEKLFSEITKSFSETETAFKGVLKIGTSFVNSWKKLIISLKAININDHLLSAAFVEKFSKIIPKPAIIAICSQISTAEVGDNGDDDEDDDNDPDDDNDDSDNDDDNDNDNDNDD